MYINLLTTAKFLEQDDEFRMGSQTYKITYVNTRQYIEDVAIRFTTINEDSDVENTMTVHEHTIFKIYKHK